MTTRIRIVLSAWLACVLALGGCNGPTSPAGGAAASRTYRMGFSAIPPKADQNVAVQSLLLWSQRADAAIMSAEVPWDSLLDGVPPESLVARDSRALAQFYRGRGLELWLYIDPANGLNRAGEADALVRRGRSIAEPAVQELYRRYAVAADTMLRPDHLGLALETNLIRMASPPSLYAAIRTAVNAAAADVRAADARVPLGVSVQVDAAWGRLGGSGTYAGVDTDFVDFPFVEELGLSSYPYLAGFADPDSVPLDYYARLLEGRTVPAAVTEGGWTSASVGGVASSPEAQRRYIVRQGMLLDSARAAAVFQLTFTDLDLSGGLPPGSILPLFAHLGLVDVNLNPKPALAAWDAAFARRRNHTE
jgi:hypothetical protein